MTGRREKIDSCWEFSKTLVEEHGRVVETNIGRGHIMTLTYSDGHKLIIDERCSEVNVSVNVVKKAENNYIIDIDNDNDTTNAQFRVTKDNQGTTLFTVNEDGSVSFSNGLQITATGIIQVTDEIWHEVDGAGEPAFENDWGNVGGDYENCSFMIDPAGFVHLKGRVIGGLSNTVIFTLPVGKRVTNQQVFNTEMQYAGRVEITSDGGVKLVA